MSDSFREATNVERMGEGSFRAIIPDGWQQGRGAFGGVVFGVLLRAAQASEGDLGRVARTFSADVAGPVSPGLATVLVRVLRRGRSQTNLQAELVQGDQVLASALCTLSAPRPGHADVAGRGTAVPPVEAGRDWRELPIFPIAPPIGPVFAQHYEYRCVDAFPFAAGPLPVSAGFVRERSARGELDAPALTALLDSFWPALYSTLSDRLPMTTVSFSAQYLLHDRALTADEPLFFRAYSLAQRDGYCVEFRELWSSSTLVALNQQTFAILG